MAGKAVKQPEGYYIWEGGRATLKEMRKAPSWTVFPGHVAVQGELPYGPEWGEPGYPVDEEAWAGEGPAWFPASGIGNSSYGPAEGPAKKHGFGRTQWSGDWDVEIQADDTIASGYDDNDAAYDAVGGGWTLVKAPLYEEWEEGRPTPHYRFYVADVEHTSDDGNRFWYESAREHYVGAPAATKPKAADLKVVNRHRKVLGMKPLDMADGWTVQEVEEMARSIRTRGRLPNPKRGRFHDEMVRRNPELGNQYQYMDEIQGYAVELAPRVGGQRSIRDIYNVVISAQDEWSPLVVKWAPMFGGNRALAAEQIGQHLMAGVQLALEIDSLFDEMKASARARAERNPEGLPLHPDNALVVRVRQSARDKLLPAYLYYVLMHLHAQGWFRQRATGTVQQCIRKADVEDIPVEGHGKLGRLVKVTTGAQPDKLREGDVVLQRVGDCGQPYLVTGTDPLTFRGAAVSNPSSNRSCLKRKLMR